ncbi:MAG: hypothetical protein ACOC9Q_02415 [bacterium]
MPTQPNILFPVADQVQGAALKPTSPSPAPALDRLGESAGAERARSMMWRIWQVIESTDDHPLAGAAYPALRMAPHGPRDMGG